MAVKVDIQTGETTNVESTNFNEFANMPSPDFNDSDTSEYGEEYSVNLEDEEAKLEKKRKIKSDLFTMIAAGVVNAIPIALDYFKHRKDPVPYKTNRRDLVKLGISMVLPTIQTIDTAVLDSKIQRSVEEKTPFTLSDVRNVVNVCQAYPSTSKALKNFMNNASRQSVGQQAVPVDSNTKRDAIVSCVNVIAPYIANKFSNDQLTFVEKCASVIPLKIFGGMVKRVASLNPKTRQVYEVVTNAVKVVDFGNKTLINNVVRSSNGMRQGPANQINSALDFFQDITGMNRGNISAYNDYNYNGWGGSRFNSF